MLTKVLPFLLVLPAVTKAANSTITSIKPSLDVGIIVSDMAKAKAFYGGVLGLKESASVPMPPGEGTTMVRFQAGTAVLKLRAFPNAAKYPGSMRAAVGFRLLTIYVSDLDSIIRRWKDAGGKEPRLSPGMVTKGSQVTMLTDPDGNQIELVGMPPEIDVVNLDRIAIGLMVSSVEKTREFYGKLLALDEEEPLALGGGNKEYRFMAGKTQIKFFQAPADLPKRTGSINDVMGLRYFTFMVRDVDAMAQVLKARGANIVLPPSDFGSIARIMMIADPDGNWIEFAGPKSR